MVGVAGLVAMSGCASDNGSGMAQVGDDGSGMTFIAGESELLVAAGSYDDAFMAAVDEVRRLGFEPQLLDRRAGLIEAGPARSASLLEPWTSSEGIVENTLHHQRRVVRVAFEPAEFSPEVDSAVNPLVAPMIDLTAASMPLRMIATVVVERQQAPIEHRVSWSLAARSEAWRYDPATGERRKAIWRAVRRDPALENRILTACERHLSGS